MQGSCPPAPSPAPHPLLGWESVVVRSQSWNEDKSILLQLVISRLLPPTGLWAAGGQRSSLISLHILPGWASRKTRHRAGSVKVC